MNEQTNLSTVSFAVDLSKEEYIEFYKTLTRFSSAKTVQRIGLILILLMVAVPFASLYKAYGMEALLSWDALSLLIPAALLLIYNFVLMPQLRRRQAARGYDTAIAGGQVFAGTVTVTDRAVTKTTVSGSMTMSFADKILFFEQADMLVFINTAGRGIVLPARCMTHEQAQTVKTLATTHLPPAFCKSKASIVCDRETPFEMPQTTPAATLFETAVSFEQADRAFVAKEMAARSLKSSVLSGGIIGFLLALLTANKGELLFACIVFWGTFLVVVGFTFFTGRARTKYLLLEQNFRFTFKVTEKAVIADGGERRGVTAIPWAQLAHAVESENFLEFYNKKQYIAVPKRLIADMDSFRALIDACRKERNE